MEPCSMTTRPLPSFHDAYVQVLAQLETLKRVYTLQLTNEPAPNLLLTYHGGSNMEREASNGGYATQEREIRFFVDMNEKNCIKDVKNVDKESVKKDRKKRSINFLNDSYNDVMTGCAHEIEGHKKVKNLVTENGTSRKLDLNVANDQHERNRCENTKEDGYQIKEEMKNRHSSRLELKKNTNRQRETRDEVYKELKEVLTGYVALEERDSGKGQSENYDNLVVQIGKSVREVFELLQLEKIQTLNLKDSVIQKDEEIRKLRSEKADLQTKLENTLCTVQQNSLFENSPDVLNRFNENQPTPVSTEISKTVLLPDAGEEVAAEVIRSLSMTPNHRPTTSPSETERVQACPENVASPFLGFPSNKLAVASKLVERAAGANTPLSNRRRGPEIGDGFNGRAMSEKTKRLCEIGRELAKRAGVTLQLQTSKSTPIHQVKRYIRARKHGGEMEFDSDTESVIKKVTRTELRPWVNSHRSLKHSFLTALEGITETAHEESGGQIIEEVTETIDRGAEFVELGNQKEERAPVLESAHANLQKESTSVDLTTKGLLKEDKRKLVGEGEKAGTGIGNYREYECGVSTKGGDTNGVLRVYESGVFQVFCHCSEATCPKGSAMNPWAFERHGGRGASKKWRESIWVKQGTQRVPVSRVKELDAYLQSHHCRREGKKPGVGAAEPVEGPQPHRDEFVTCLKCLKQRRFRRRNLQECQIYHDAVNNPKWECANFRDNKYTCEEDEEREVRRAQRGCPRSRYCLGCVLCVCLGCSSCRFNNCRCPSCTEFLSRSLSIKPGKEVATQTCLTRSLNSPLSATALDPRAEVSPSQQCS